MKKLLFIISLFVATNSMAQEPEIEDGVLVSSTGFRIEKGDFLKLGPWHRC